MTISKYVRFTVEPIMPMAPKIDPSPGGEIVAHLRAELPARGVIVREHRDIEYAHELKCEVGERTYEVFVGYDWLSEPWWEVFWYPRLGFFARLLGGSEEDELRRLAIAVSKALEALPGIREKRWYRRYGVNVGPESAHTAVPEMA